MCFAGDSGPAPAHTQWTVLCLDLSHILSLYLSRTYSYVRNVKLCANMCVKNVFTSDTEFQPGESRGSGDGSYFHGNQFEFGWLGRAMP